VCEPILSLDVVEAVQFNAPVELSIVIPASESGFSKIVQVTSCISCPKHFATYKKLLSSQIEVSFVSIVLLPYIVNSLETVIATINSPVV
jgi:hypothetical protein